jgi:hypothetical protein
MSAMLPPLMQESGVPFDLFIAALTDQLDKVQGAMALKARVGKLPLTFAVKEVSLDLRAYVHMVDDDVYLRPAGPGDTEASTVRLSLTTITKPMIEENAMDFAPEEPKFSLREALGDSVSEEDQRRLERIGVRTVSQLTELRKTAGADVIARLSRMPVNRLQQALMRASAPHVTAISHPQPGIGAQSPERTEPRVHVNAPLLAPGRIPLVRARGRPVPVVEAGQGRMVLQPLASQLGADAEMDFGDGKVATLPLREGALGRWQESDAPGARP